MGIGRVGAGRVAINKLEYDGLCQQVIGVLTVCPVVLAYCENLGNKGEDVVQDLNGYGMSLGPCAPYNPQIQETKKTKTCFACHKSDCVELSAWLSEVPLYERKLVF